MPGGRASLILTEIVPEVFPKSGTGQQFSRHCILRGSTVWKARLRRYIPAVFQSLMFEFFIILILLVGNGIFAMTEIALVSARKGRLKKLAGEGSAGARQALELLENPERFLSTVQIGITLVGVLSGAYGGAALSGYLQPWIAAVPPLEPFAGKIAFGIVVTGITYLSLVIGELAPKGIALRHAEAIAVTMAPPMALLSKVARPLVRLLELSTHLLMRLFGGSAASQTGPTREEVQVLVREGIITGTVD